MELSKVFLGIEIARSDAGIYSNQRKYTTRSLNCKPSALLLEQNHALLIAQDVDDIPDISLYRRIVRRLIYLTISRLDIAYTVHTLSQFLAHPKSIHLQATYRLLQYLKGTCDQDIFLSAKSPLNLTTFCDADWAVVNLPNARLQVMVLCWYHL